MYFKINSLKSHKLKEEFEQIQIPHMNFYYLQEKKLTFRKKTVDIWKVINMEEIPQH